LKNKKIYFAFCFVLFSFCAHAQISSTIDSFNLTKNVDSNFKFFKFISGNFSYFNVDILDNLYFIGEKNQLKKLNAKGDSAGVFNDVKKFGNPTFIDVSNPLKILVFYKNYSTVVILDRFLAFRNSINFRNQSIFKVKAIATSYDNSIWLFDEQDFKLKKIKDDGKVLSETNDWRQIFDIAPNPIEIIDRDGSVYLYDNEKGMYIFDYYGTLKYNLPFLHWEHIAVANNKIMGFVDNALESYELKSLNLKTYKLPQFFKNYIDIKAMNGKVYLLKNNGIEIYDIL
jgi:hypothetical protein